MKIFFVQFVTPWTITRQAPLSMGIHQARILEWVAMPSSRGSPSPAIEPGSLTSNLHWQGGSLSVVPAGKPTVRFSYPQTKKWPQTGTLGLEPQAFPKPLMATRAQRLPPQPFIPSLNRELEGTCSWPAHKRPRHGDSQACAIKQLLSSIKK